MGDFGAYGLSALIALVGFDLFDQGLVGLGFLATLLSYPCVEIIRIFVVRISKGESPFRADNQHSHNLLNEYFSNLVKSKTSGEFANGRLNRCVFGDARGRHLVSRRSEE